MSQYQGVWTLQQQMQALTSGQWVTDPLFDYTTLLLQGDAGANGAQNNVFYDTSPNQFAITRNGNTTQGTFSPFSLQPGAWSAYFDGDGDYITAPNSSNYSFSTNFTVECFAYPVAFSNTPVLFDTRTSAGNTAAMYLYINTSGYLVFVAGGTTITTSLTVSLNAWQHFAVVRSSNTVTVYINGISCGSATISTNLSDTGLTIGAPIDQRGATTTNKYSGYMSNLRFNNTTAIYTSNFTPSVLPFSAVSGVTLLTLQSNRFVDNSTAAATLTPNGTTSIQAFSPFAPQFQYTASGTGGSGYFDGSDYLATTTTAISSGSTAFQIEGWVYPTAISGAATIFGGVTNGIELQYNTTNICINKAGVSNILIPSTPPTINAWNHILACRNTSGVISIYLNGVRRATATGDTNTFSATTANIGGTSYVTGYLAGVRYINGSNIVDPTQTSFTIPSAPVTAATNTANLLNFTNAGILDGTMKNNLETVGNASVSTSVVKYGSGSMYFDGTGDWLTTPLSPWMNLGTSDFTMECWVYFTSVSSTQMFFSSNYNAGTGAGGWAFLYRQDNTTIKFTCNSNVSYEKTWVPVVGTWYHVAVSRANANLRIFVNGVQLGTTSTSTDNIASASTLYVGSNVTTQLPLFGYMDDARITVGVARYTQNFIPPSVALPRQ